MALKVLGYVRRIMDGRSGEIIIPPYLELAGPHGILCQALALSFQEGC